MHGTCVTFVVERAGVVDKVELFDIKIHHDAGDCADVTTVFWFNEDDDEGGGGYGHDTSLFDV